jgi:hypothetical protein
VNFRTTPEDIVETIQVIVRRGRQVHGLLHHK